MFHVHTPMKSSIVERWNRTLKNKMFLQFSLNSSYKWYDMIYDLVHKYNHTIHRTIKMKPAMVKKKHEKMLLSTVYHDNNVKFKQKTDLRVGDYVRTSFVTGAFRRGYLPNWGVGIYRIEEIKPTYPPTFKLSKENGEMEQRPYYRRELKKVRHPQTYLIEKVVKHDPRRGYLVKWFGYPDSANSYVK